MKVAIVGATGVVGREILRVLDERALPVDDLVLFASRDRDEPVAFRGREFAVRAGSFDALLGAQADVVFFASSDDASAASARALADAGTFVIDNSSTFRLEHGVPLVVPEVNPHDLDTPGSRIFPVANCTAIVLCVALRAIERAAGLSEVRVATYQAVSGAGRAGLEQLEAEEHAATGDAPPPALGPFVAPIFRNVVPLVGSGDGTTDTGEEQKVAAETRKMLGRPDLYVAATTVRVPVRRAHSEAVFFKTEQATSVTELGLGLAAAPGIVYHPTGVVTPQDVEDQDLVHVARLRPETDDATDTRFQMWVVGDQLRKGAATNGVQILEALLERGRIGERVAK